MKTAIYLSGGGARGAYQAGILKGIAQILDAKDIPCHILSCVSAGAINGAYLAMHADDFTVGVNRLAQMWSNLRCADIYDVSNYSLIKSLFRNFTSLAFHYRPKQGGYLLDTTPLKKLLIKELDFGKIQQHINNNRLAALEMAATCYDQARTISFVHTAKQYPSWQRTRHISQTTVINYEHILASAAFPLFFPAIELNKLHYGDGGLRLSAPLRACVNLGADKILIIGTRRLAPTAIKSSLPQHEQISFGKILGTMINALFLDNLDRDLELLNKINETIALIPDNIATKSKWRNIKALYLRPEEDLGELATSKEYSLPTLLNYMLTSFGAERQIGDFLSFLLFEADYCAELVELGYQTALRQQTTIREFFTTKI